MTARIGKTKLQTKDGRTRLEPARGYRSVSARIGADAKARRKAAAWIKQARGRATVEKRG